MKIGKKFEIDIFELAVIAVTLIIIIDIINNYD